MTSSDSGMTAGSDEAVLSLDSRGSKHPLDSEAVVTHITPVSNHCNSIRENCPLIVIFLAFQIVFKFIFFIKTAEGKIKEENILQISGFCS